MESTPVNVGRLTSGVASQLFLVGDLHRDRRGVENIRSVRSPAPRIRSSIRFSLITRALPDNRIVTAVVRSATAHALSIAQKQAGANVPLADLCEELPAVSAAVVRETNPHISVVRAGEPRISVHLVGRVPC